MNGGSLKTRFGVRLKENEPLLKHVNIRIGGPARFYFVAETSDELAEAVSLAAKEGMRWTVLGSGSNVLPSDAGFDGLVVQAANRKWEIRGTEARAESGVPAAFLARKTAEAGLAGFEWAISLPGTIGGAVYGNAGCFGGEMKDAVKSVETLRVTGGEAERKTYANEACRFGYRGSVFKDNKELILSATLALEKDDPEACRNRLDEALAKRKESQPLAEASAGCMFKNFEFEDESAIKKLMDRAAVPREFLEKKRIPAGWLVELADLKGARIGGAKVSEKHGNFLVNAGNATASDVVQLLSLIKMRLRDGYGIQLTEEVQYIGF